MQYSRWGDWSYNKHYNNGSNRICSVTNNEGKEMLLKSITLHLAVAASGTSANWGDSVSGNGGSVSFYLSTSYNSAVNASDTKTISSPKKSTYKNSDGTLRTYYTNDLPQVTFSFGDGVLIKDGSTLNFYFVRTSGDNVVICPKQDSRWDGYKYSTQNVTGYATDTYTSPSYSLNDITPEYGVLGETSFTADYNIDKGSNDISWTNVRLKNTADKVIADYDLNTDSVGDNIKKSFKLGSDKFSDGSEYRGSIRFSDGKNIFETGYDTIYTYRTPVIKNASIGSRNISGTGNVLLSWETNGRKWNEKSENNFTTHFKFGNNDWISVDSNPNLGENLNKFESISHTITRANIDASFSKTERSSDYIDTSITLLRTNP